MKKQITITSDDPILETIHFRHYKNIVERGVVPFVPRAEEKQTVEILTPWGETLTAVPGDMIIFEVDYPDDRWPVNAAIFDETYVITRPGFCAKRVATALAPLTDLTNGDEDAEVVVHSLEGVNAVRAGDFYLARGVKGEIWAVSCDKVDGVIAPAVK